MKPLIYALIVLLLCPFQVHSQKIKIDWGKEFKAGTKASFNVPLGQKDDFFYNLRFDNKGTFMKINLIGHIEKLDENLDRVSDVQLKSGEKDFQYDFLYIRDGNLHVFTSDYDKKLKRKTLFVTVYDENGKPKGKIRNRVLMIKYVYNKQNSGLDFKLSADSSRLLISQQFDSKKKEKATIYYAVVETNGHEVLQEGKYKLPYLDDNLSIESALLDNDGNTYFFTQVWEEREKGMKKWEVTFSPHLIIIDKEGDLVIDKELIYNGLSLTSVNAKINEDNELFIAAIGLVQNKKKYILNGFFFGTYNFKEDQFNNTQKISFDKKLLIKFGKKIGKDGELKGNYVYHLKLFLDEENGGGYIIAENSYSYYSSSSTGSSDHLHFVRNELIVVKFDNENTVEWTQLIPKKQETSVTVQRAAFGLVNYIPKALIELGTKYSSYLAFIKNGTLYVLYNDHEKNFTVRNMVDIKNMPSYNKARATIVTVNPEDGKWKKKYLFSGKDDGIVFSPVSSWAKGDNVIIMGEKKNVNRYGRLIIE
jgi:hypothetical protein